MFVINETKKRSSFSGKIGFVLAAAGSAVGLGNLWRFPIIVAKDGGAIFLFVYIIMAVTFGFTLLSTEIAIGRNTHQSCVGAYQKLNKHFKFLGPIAAIVPFFIFPYYCVIGGWVSKYTLDYAIGRGQEAVADGYFTGFITSQYSPILWSAFFILLTAVIVFLGVEKGIEKISQILMPILCVLIVGICIFALTIRDSVSGRTAIDGLKIYLIPNFKGMTIGHFFKIVLDAVTQMFYSMSIAMGIMITYGSYAKKDTNLIDSTNQIEIFDTAIAIIAGMIIIPVVFAFQGNDGLSSAGPSLLFISLPKVFNEMHFAGNIIGAAFFLLVFFAALTSSISLMEAVVSNVMDKFNVTRKIASGIVTVLSLVIALVVCLGYNVWYFEYKLPNGSVGQILDIVDYAMNNILMPIVAFLTCILVGWCIDTKLITKEISLNAKGFLREKMYIVIVKYIAPIILFLILLSSFGIFDRL